MQPDYTIEHPRKVTVGLVSDTHGWLDPRLAGVFADVDLIIHAGDVGQPSVITELEAIAPTYTVKGNIDGGELRFLPLSLMLEVNGRRIAALHIAGSPRKPNRNASVIIHRAVPDIIVVGHSHIPVVGRVASTLWINPGAAGRIGFHTERYAALLHIDHPDGTISIDRVHLGPRSAQT